MGLFDLFRGADPASRDLQEASLRRRADIAGSLALGRVPAATAARLEATREGRLPWTATLTPAELLIARSHGLRPIAAVSANCWLHYGHSWTEGHQQGWHLALQRLRDEARAAGANAVLDVKMRTIPLAVENSMDFTLVGTAVRVDGLPPSAEPVVATVPALEFVRLLEADVVPVGLAVGARYEWLADWYGDARQAWRGNTESRTLSQFWDRVRRAAHAELRRNARDQGNGVLAHLDWSQMFEVESGEGQPTRYLGRHIVVASIVDGRPGGWVPYEIGMALDMRAGETPLTGRVRHHQSYASNEGEGAI